MDNVFVFVSEEFITFLFSMRLALIKTSPYAAETNIGSRFVNFLRSSLRAYFSESHISGVEVFMNFNTPKFCGS